MAERERSSIHRLIASLKGEQAQTSSPQKSGEEQSKHNLAAENLLPVHKTLLPLYKKYQKMKADLATYQTGKQLNFVDKWIYQDKRKSLEGVIRNLYLELSVICASKSDFFPFIRHMFFSLQLQPEHSADYLELLEWMRRICLDQEKTSSTARARRQFIEQIMRKRP